MAEFMNKVKRIFYLVMMGTVIGVSMGVGYLIARL